MKKILWALIVIFGLSDFAMAASTDETITVSNTAVGLTASKITTYTSYAICTLETAQIRFRVSGYNPTSAIGHILDTGNVVELTTVGDMIKFRAIRTGTSDGVLTCSYY
jgi:hypothetical protein